jgi:hypothetical protein
MARPALHSPRVPFRYIPCFFPAVELLLISQNREAEASPKWKSSIR